MTRHRTWTLAVLITVGMLGLFGNTSLVGNNTASAADRRLPGAICVNEGHAVFSQVSQASPAPHYSRGTITGGDSPWGIICPIVEDDAFPKTAVTILNVHGYLASGTVRVKACSVEHWSSQGNPTTFCTGEKEMAAKGNFYVHFDNLELQNAWSSSRYTDFAYVSIRFTGITYDNTGNRFVGDKDNRVNGIYLADH